MQSLDEKSVVSLDAPPTFSGPQGWEDLPDCLLHSIVDRLGSFRDLLGFTTTCSSWHAAFSSYPSKSTFRTKFPPLLIQTNIRVEGALKLVTCKVIDPANPNTTLCCHIPQETLEKMTFIGSSFGNLIFYYDGYCRIVDVFSGVEFSTPRLPSNAKCHVSSMKGTLTGPLESPNTHLLVCTGSFLFDLPVRNGFWFELQLPRMFVIYQILELNGQFIILEDFWNIHTLQLAPQLGLQKIRTDFLGTMDERFHVVDKFLVACGDMLVMHNDKKLYRLDMSVKTATWMAMEKLDKWALFIGAEVFMGRNAAPLSCMSPELWGGMSNILYLARESQTWALCGLCGSLDPLLDAPPIEPGVGSAPVRLSISPLWLYPSMLYSGGQRTGPKTARHTTSFF